MKKTGFLMLAVSFCMFANAQQSIECQIARQQILVMSQAQAQVAAQAYRDPRLVEQEEAIRRAQLTPFQRAQADLYSSGAQLGRGLGGLMGAEDPQVQANRQLQEAIQRYKALCEK